ncbi:MAG: hypothetical protein HZA77_00815 [Candidatus Schekmanbacteria bacterium]|nr:hypothetical protein [Candidatus Schekmanbacteria bacterium]
MRKLLFDNFGLKVFSFLLALTLWFYLTIEKGAELNFPVKVQVVNLPESMVIAEGAVNNATIWVGGLRRSLLNLTPENMVIRVDLRDASEGTVVYPLKADSISLPQNVNVKMIVPQFLNLKVEKLIKKKLKVRPKIVGSPPQGYEIASVSESPEYVEVMGKRSVIEKMQEIFTYPIDVSELNQALNFEVPVDVDSTGLKMAGSGRMIKVKIVLKQKIISRELSELPVIPGNKPGNKNEESSLDIEPLTVAVEVRGPEILVENLKREDIQVIFKTENLREGKIYRKKPDVVLPDGIELIGIVPEYFNVKMNRKG